MPQQPCDTRSQQFNIPGTNFNTNPLFCYLDFLMNINLINLSINIHHLSNHLQIFYFIAYVLAYSVLLIYIVTLQGSSCSIDLSYFLSFNQYLSNKMQSVSLGNLKLQAHHDKITNLVANHTKIQFLWEEIDVLKEIKEQAQVLQSLAKPTQNYQQNVQLLQKRVQDLKKELNIQTVCTRRQMALLEMQTINNLQFKIQEKYDQSAFMLDQRLQYFEDNLQEKQLQQKMKISSINQPYVACKEHHLRINLDRFLLKRKKVNVELKRRLILVGKVKELQERRKNNIFAKAKKDGVSALTYQFMNKKCYLYPSKSMDRIHQELQKPQQDKKIKKQKQPLPSRKPFILSGSTKMSSRMILNLQQRMFTDQTLNFKKQNEKLQYKITTLKNAIEKKQNRQTLKMLQKGGQLNMEQAKARQLLAFMNMQGSFKTNLQSYSLKWIQQQEIWDSKNGSKVKQFQDETDFCQKMPNYLQPIRSKSGPKLNNPTIIKIQLPIQKTFSKLQQPNKSNQRTNSSLEYCQKP